MNRMKLLMFVVALLPGLSQAEVTRASQWLDRVVVTSEGELLGRVEDFALDASAASLRYFVVSVGSYLIEENLIAVTPASLRESDGGEYLVIDAQALADAPRFSDEAWPEEAPETRERMADAERAASEATERGGARVAEIVGRDRKLTVGEDGSRSITPIARSDRGGFDGVTAKRYQGGGLSQQSGDVAFRRFDTNGDGYLSETEIAGYIKPGYSFADYDSDGNGGLDAFELKVLQEDR